MTVGAAVPTGEIELFSVGGHDGYLRGVNDAFARLLGLTAAELNGLSILELVHPQDLPGVVGALGRLESGEPEVVVDSRFVQRDGRCVHLQWVARPVPGGDFWWAAGRDTTAFHRLVAEHADLQAQLDLVVGSSVAMWELDIASGRLLWESRAAQVLRLGGDDPPGSVHELAALAHPDDRAAVTSAVERCATLADVEVRFRVGVTDERWLSLRGRVVDRERRGRPGRVVGVLLDVTGERAMEEQLLRMATRDALTGVQNRRAFEHALRGEWRRAKRSGLPVSVLMVDVDRLKDFNDAHGHLLGDEALCAIARALEGVVHREGDLVARFGGEEFAAVLPDTDEDGAAAVGRAMVEAVREVVVRQAGGRRLSVSVGISTWTPAAEPDLTAVTAVDRADRAVVAARLEGRDRAVAYGSALAERDAVQSAVRAGLAAGEFTLHYQPVVGLASGRPVAVEALVRWNRPGCGLVPPSDFVPAAEQSSLICALDTWVLNEACGRFAEWVANGHVPEEFHVAANVSGRHVAEPSFVDTVLAALDAAGLPPERLELEVTETALAATVPTGEALGRLRRLGVRVAIDDFGTGYTSVGQLPHLPADTLKIDRSFAASTDPRRRELVRLMVGAAHAYDLGVVAEGVEDDETHAFLRAAGCDLAQGWLFGRPMPADAVPGWLADASGEPDRSSW